MRETNKAALAAKDLDLEKRVLPAETIPEPSATIIDVMSLVRKMKGNDQTFSQLAESALTHILHEGVRSHRIDAHGLRYLSRRLVQERREIKQGEHYRNTVPKHGARSPDPAMEKVSQQLGQ